MPMASPSYKAKADTTAMPSKIRQAKSSLLPTWWAPLTQLPWDCSPMLRFHRKNITAAGMSASNTSINLRGKMGKNSTTASITTWWFSFVLRVTPTTPPHFQSSKRCSTAPTTNPTRCTITTITLPTTNLTYGHISSRNPTARPFFLMRTFIPNNITSLTTP